MAKIQPAERAMTFVIPDNTICVIDIARCLSAINRRLYRQGMNYYVERISCHFGQASVGYVQALPDTWMTQNAWKKGFKTWQKMQNEYMDGQGAQLKGKWADFKIKPDDLGHTEITPVDNDGSAIVLGEWVYSNFVYDDAGTARSPTIHMVGSVTADTSIGLIEAYANSRNYPGSEPSNPSEIQTGFYAQFHGVGDIDDELGTDLRDDNDLPPYDFDNYFGGASNGDVLPLKDHFATTDEYPVAQMSGFIAPCGLIKVYSDTAGGTTTLIVHLAPGPYKGVMAEPMGQ